MPQKAKAPVPSHIRSITKAIENNKMFDYSRYAQLATITHDGFPACRTVRMRGMFKGEALIIAADSRTKKMQNEGPQGSVAELCWHFPYTREQFRFRTNVTVVNAECKDDELRAERVRVWREVSEYSRDIYHAAAPGEKKADVQLGDLDIYEMQNPDKNEPSPNFELLLLFPILIDHLMLPRPGNTETSRAKPMHKESLLAPSRSQKRWQHTIDPEMKEWVVTEINP